MEPNAKRRRVAYYDDGYESHDSDQHDEARFDSRNKLKSKLESIFEKYGRDFSGVGDEIDLRTGAIVVNNGHLSAIEDEVDAGLEDATGYWEDNGAYGMDDMEEDTEDEDDQVDEYGHIIPEELDDEYYSESDLSIIDDDGINYQEGRETKVLDNEGEVLDSLNLDPFVAQHLETPNKTTRSLLQASDPKWRMPSVPEELFHRSQTQRSPAKRHSIALANNTPRQSSPGGSLWRYDPMVDYERRLRPTATWLVKHASMSTNPNPSPRGSRRGDVDSGELGQGHVMHNPRELEGQRTVPTFRGANQLPLGVQPNTPGFSVRTSAPMTLGGPGPSGSSKHQKAIPIALPVARESSRIVNKGPEWTEEESRRLVHFRTTTKLSYEELEPEFPGRTWSGLKARWYIIKKDGITKKSRPKPAEVTGEIIICDGYMVKQDWSHISDMTERRRAQQQDFRRRQKAKVEYLKNLENQRPSTAGSTEDELGSSAYQQTPRHDTSLQHSTSRPTPLITAQNSSKARRNLANELPLRLGVNQPTSNAILRLVEDAPREIRNAVASSLAVESDVMRPKLPYNNLGTPLTRDANSLGQQYKARYPQRSSGRENSPIDIVSDDDSDFNVPPANPRRSPTPDEDILAPVNSYDLADGADEADVDHTPAVEQQRRFSDFKPVLEQSPLLASPVNAFLEVKIEAKTDRLPFEFYIGDEDEAIDYGCDDQGSRSSSELFVRSPSPAEVDCHREADMLSPEREEDNSSTTCRSSGVMVVVPKPNRIFSEEIEQSDDFTETELDSGNFNDDFVESDLHLGSEVGARDTPPIEFTRSGLSGLLNEDLPPQMVKRSRRRSDSSSNASTCSHRTAASFINKVMQKDERIIASSPTAIKKVRRKLRKSKRTKQALCKYCPGGKRFHGHPIYHELLADLERRRGAKKEKDESDIDYLPPRGNQEPVKRLISEIGEHEAAFDDGAGRLQSPVPPMLPNSNPQCAPEASDVDEDDDWNLVERYVRRQRRPWLPKPTQISSSPQRSPRPASFLHGNGSQVYDLIPQDDPRLGIAQSSINANSQTPGLEGGERHLEHSEIPECVLPVEESHERPKPFREESPSHLLHTTAVVEPEGHRAGLPKSFLTFPLEELPGDINRSQDTENSPGILRLGSEGNVSGEEEPPLSIDASGHDWNDPILIASDPIESMHEEACLRSLDSDQVLAGAEEFQHQQNSDDQSRTQAFLEDEPTEFAPIEPESSIPRMSLRSASVVSVVVSDSDLVTKTPRKEVPSTSQVTTLSSMIDDVSEDELSFLTPGPSRVIPHRKPRPNTLASPRCGSNGITCGRAFCIRCSSNDSDVDF